MPCTPTETKGELEFVQALLTRSRVEGQCRGPLLRLAMWSWRVLTLEQIFDSPAASDVLWQGVHDDGIMGIHFSLCAAHWLDLACLCWMRAHTQDRADFNAEAEQLLRDVCDTAGWDAKEIVNMFAWRHARLT